MTMLTCAPHGCCSDCTNSYCEEAEKAQNHAEKRRLIKRDMRHCLLDNFLKMRERERERSHALARQQMHHSLVLFHAFHFAIQQQQLPLQTLLAVCQRESNATRRDSEVQFLKSLSDLTPHALLAQ